MDHETMEQRLVRLEEHRAAGTLRPGGWGDGHEIACLLSAIAPECADGGGDASRCPAEVMALWLAEITPSIYDHCSGAAREGIVDRYVALARRWHVLDAAGWRRAEYRVRGACVREAMAHTNDAGAIAACERVIGLCARVVAGTEPTADERAAEAEAATAWAAAWDRIAGAVLDALEAEISAMEQK